MKTFGFCFWPVKSQPSSCFGCSKPTEAADIRLWSARWRHFQPIKARLSRNLLSRHTPSPLYCIFIFLNLSPSFGRFVGGGIGIWLIWYQNKIQKSLYQILRHFSRLSYIHYLLDKNYLKKIKENKTLKKWFISNKNDFNDVRRN